MKPIYVDAFAGTGEIPRRKLQGFFKHEPGSCSKLRRNFAREAFARALEVNPPFHHDVFIEKDPGGKCAELEALKKEFSDLDIKVINEDGEHRLIELVRRPGIPRRQRAVGLPLSVRCAAANGRSSRSRENEGS